MHVLSCGYSEIFKNTFFEDHRGPTPSGTAFHRNIFDPMKSRHLLVQTHHWKLQDNV